MNIIEAPWGDERDEQPDNFLATAEGIGPVEVPKAPLEAPKSPTEAPNGPGPLVK